MSETKSRRHVNKNATITVVFKGNPKRPASLSFDRFALYKNGMIVAEYLEQGGRSGDINHDVEAGYISLSE